MKSAASATGVSPVAEKSVARRRFHYDSRFTPPILITCILLAGQVSFGFLESFQRTALAIITSIAIEMLLGRMFTGKWPHVASAYITAISVGILIRSPEFWPYALCSAISITSKYVLRLKGRHIWNPSNFGISAMLFLAPFAVSTLSVQWGNYVPPMVVIWVLGCVIIWRLKRFHITATYVASFLILSLVRHLITGHPFLAEVAPLTGPMYQLYVFFMITDPKTTVSTRRGQVIVAVLIAVAEMIFRLAQVVHAPYYALFIVGPVALLIDMWWRSRHTAAVPEPATPQQVV